MLREGPAPPSPRAAGKGRRIEEGRDRRRREFDGGGRRLFILEGKGVFGLLK